MMKCSQRVALVSVVVLFFTNAGVHTTAYTLPFGTNVLNVIIQGMTIFVDKTTLDTLSICADRKLFIFPAFIVI